MTNKPGASATTSETLPKQLPWYAQGLAFTCTRCGNCCGGAPGYVWVSPPELEAIAAHVGLSPERFGRQHLRRVGRRLSLLELENGDCEFLARLPDGKTTCLIHPVRPRQCRTWPFWASNLRSRRAWDGAARNCPGMNNGRHHPLSVIRELLRRNARAALPV